MGKTVALIGLKNTNFGDTIILEATKYLIESLRPDINVKVTGLFPAEGIPQKIKIVNSYEKSYFSQIRRFLLFKKYLCMKDHYLPKYYNEELEGVSCVIFAGGGIIKFTRESFFYPIYAIVKYCKKHNIPVYFNAVGVEGYDRNNFCSMLLKRILNEKCIKKITTRDDIENLEKYVKDRSKIDIAGDSALWAKEVYGDISGTQSDVIGIGIIRGKIFTDYGVDFSEDNLAQTYVNIISELEKRGYKWQMFCNGLESDYALALEVLNRLQKEDVQKYLAPRPVTSRELVKLITGYKALIAARLHANITAVSYNIPQIGLVWNDKLKLFGKILDCPENFIEKENLLNSKLIVDRLETVLSKAFLPPPP